MIAFFLAMYIDANSEKVSQLDLIHQYHFTDNLSAPLVFLVHGRAGSIKSMSPFRRCIPDYFNVIQVQAPFADKIGGWSWWDVTPSREQTIKLAIEAKEILEYFITESQIVYNLKPRKVVAIGFSQGGITLSVIAQINPGILNALAILASYALEIPQSKVDHLNSNLIVFAAHGRADDIVSLDKLEQSLEIFKSKNIPVELTVDDVGHKVGTNGMKALKNWLQKIE